MLEKIKLREVLEAGLAIAFVIAVILYKSPIPQGDDEYANYFKTHFECHLILKDKEVASDIVILTGRDLKSGRDTSVSDTTKWVLNNFDIFNIGDTILKDKGKYNIIIKSKNRKTIILPLRRGGKIYSDKA